MKKLLLTLLTVVCAVSSSWADSYTITFKTGSGDGSSVSTSDASSSVVTSGSEYLNGNLALASNVYNAGSDGLKLGTSGSAGKLKVNLSTLGSVNATSIVVTAKRYNSGKATKLSLNGKTAQDLTGGFSEYTFNVNDNITYLQLESSKGTSGGAYCWIKSITVNYTPSSKTLTSIAVKTAPTKIIYNEGEYFNPAGLVITKTFSDDSNEDLSYDRNESVFSFSPSLTTELQTSNTSVQITFSGKSTNQSITVNEIPSHTAHFSVNGTINNEDDQNVKEGCNITFPSDPSNIAGKVFVGWTKTSGYAHASTSPSDLCKEATMGNADVTYYAVFATQTGDGIPFLTKIEDVRDVKAGVYALISYDKSYCLTNAEATSAPKVTAITKSGDDINIVDAMLWTLSIDNDGAYKFRSNASTEQKELNLWGAPTNDGIRITKTSSKSDAFDTWELKATDNYGLVLCHKIDETTYRYLSTYGVQDWRNYTSTSETNRAVNLYKWSSGYAFVDYCTTITPIYTHDVLSFVAADKDSYYWATFSNAKDVFMDAEDIVAYAVTASGSSLTLNDEAFASETLDAGDGEMTGIWIPANTGVLIMSSENEVDYYTAENVDVTAITASNDLFPASKDKSELEGHKFYMLAYSDNTCDPSSLGFYWGAADGAAFTSREGSAYLAIPANVTLARGFVFNDGVTTGVKNVQSVSNSSIAYNLVGQRVAANTKGIVIINGKKYIK